MAIIIQTQKTEIPIELGDLKFTFDVSDESVKEFWKEMAEIQKELEVFELSDQDEEIIEQVKDVLERGFTMMLGEGSFEEIYKISPSIVIMMNYFVQIVEGIASELQNMGFNPSQVSKAKKYVQRKSKK